MITNHVSAVFDTPLQAQEAINDLRTLGVTDHHLSVVTRHLETTTGTVNHGIHDAEVKEVDLDDTGKGLATGAGLGALLGLASAFIPGVGPFMAAGALAASIGTIGASTIAGAVLGGAAGALGGALKTYGYSEAESHYYSEAIERGGYLLAVESTNLVGSDQIRGVLTRHGGRMAPIATVVV